jgi:protein O-mannosyl-transferase
MDLSAKDKTYIKKHVRDESLRELSEKLDVSEESVLSYLKRKWGKDKFNSYVKQQSKMSKESLSEQQSFKDSSEEISTDKKLGNDNESDSPKEDHPKALSGNSLIFIFLVALCVITYVNGLSNDFLSDDLPTIVNNPKIGDFSEVYTKYYGFVRPLINFVFFHLFGLVPFFYRSANLLFHIGSVLLIFIILQRILNKRIALFSSALFAVHPLILEAVTWISAGNYSQYTFFILMSLYFYIKGKSDRKFYLLSILSYFLSLESHVIAIVYPAILATYEFSFGALKNSWKPMGTVLKRLIPFVVLSIIFIIIILMSIPERSKTLETVHEVRLGVQNPLETLPISISNYLQLYVLPDGLTLYHSDINYGFFELAVRAIVTIIFFLAILYSFFKNRVIFFFLSLFVISLSPTLNPFGFNWLIAERYTYLGSFGMLTAFAILLDKLAQNKNWRNAVYIFYIILLIAFSIRGIFRNIDWKNQDNLWLAADRTSKLSPNNHNNLGDYYGRHGDMQNAVREFKTAIALKPDYADAYHNLGNAYKEMNNYKEATASYYMAIKANPHLWQSWQNLAGLYYEMGQIDLSLEHMLNAVKVSPNDPNLYVNLAIIYLNKNDANNAVASIRQALLLDPKNQKANALAAQINQALNQSK